jgi:hypothetical protein
MEMLMSTTHRRHYCSRGIKSNQESLQKLRIAFSADCKPTPGDVLKCALRLATVLLLALVSGPYSHVALAQSCEHIPEQGSESISATITVNSSGQELTDGMVIPAYTQLRIDSIASAFGSCTGMQWVCNGGCSCQPTGYIYQRDVNHTHLWVEMSTNQQSGNYQVGNV